MGWLDIKRFLSKFHRNLCANNRKKVDTVVTQNEKKLKIFNPF